MRKAIDAATVRVHFRMSVAAVAGGLCLLAAPLAGQGPPTPARQGPGAAAWTPVHLPDGQPDVQGFWVTAVYGMSCLTDPADGVASGPVDGCRPPHKSASRIIDPPDGEVPYQPWARERQQYLLAHFLEPTKPEFVDPQQLCLPLGAVRQTFWHDFQILQYDGYVVFEYEGSHPYRIIPLDGRPHASPDIKLWMGDSRGHWEGNTLVVDVTNSNSKGRLSRAGDFASDKVHIVERYMFLDANRARFEAVFDDPSVFTRPWTIGLDLKRGEFQNGSNDDPEWEQWEEACYEGLRDFSSMTSRGAGETEPERSK